MVKMSNWIPLGWPDEARLIAQQPIFMQLTRESPLTGRCLNAGCGEGLYCSFLERFPSVSEIVNVDLSGTGQIIARFKDSRHRALDASLTDLPFADASFDSCLCTEVIEHIPDDKKAVRELGRCLRTGGRLLLSVPHPPAPFDPNHVREGYNLEQMTTLLKGHNLEVVASALCFGVCMDWLLRIWRWQHQNLGHGQRNFMPRFMVRMFGHADRMLTLGRRWDLVVLAVKR